jgi:hypothetical protein
VAFSVYFPSHLKKACQVSHTSKNKQKGLQHTAIIYYSLHPTMIVVVGVRVTSLTEFIKNMRNICISK